MKLHRYIGCIYDIVYEEMDIRFLVHKNLIGNETRNLLLLYVMTGYLPEGIEVKVKENVFRFAPECDCGAEEIKADNDYLWFAL